MELWWVNLSEEEILGKKDFKRVGGSMKTRAGEARGWILGGEEE